MNKNLSLLLPSIALSIIFALSTSYHIFANFPQANKQPLSLEINATSNQQKEEKANIYLNFENASLTSVLNYLAEQKKINIIPQKELDEAKVSLSTKNPLTLERAWNVLLTLLEMNNFSIINVEGLYRVVSNKENGHHPLPTYTSKNGTEPEDLPDSDLIVRYVYFFHDMKPDIASEILKSMLEGEESVQINDDLHACIIKEKCFNIKAAMRIIKELDTGGLRESIKIIPLKETNTEIVKKLFDEITGGEEREKTIRFAAAGAKKESTFFSKDTKIIPYPEKNSLILLGTEKNLTKVINFIYKYIDVPIGTATSRIHIKEVRYAKAESLRPILENIIKPPAGQGTEKSILVGKYKFFEDVIIAAEESGGESMRGGGNRLVVACNDEDWKRLEKFIDQLDKPQPQVAFEVMIVDIGEIQEKELGTQIQSKEGKDLGMGINTMKFKNLHSGSGITTKEPAESEGNKPPAKELSPLRLIELAGPNALGLNSPAFITLGKSGDTDPAKTNIWAVVRSVFNITNYHIIDQPYLIANNYQECEIKLSQTKLVSANLETSKGEPARATKTPKEAGTEVHLTPQINSDGIVDLKIDIKVDEFAAQQVNVESRITRRKIETKVSMLAGEVLVLGGLKTSRLDTNAYKTPILGDIPIIGSLFKSNTKSKNETNLYVFIRPSIIKPKFEGSPDEYTQLKLDYAKYQMFRIDNYVKDNDPIQRWFFKPTNETVKQRIDDARIGRFRPVDDFTHGKRQPQSVNIKEDPYFKAATSIKKSRRARQLKQRSRKLQVS